MANGDEPGPGERGPILIHFPRLGQGGTAGLPGRLRYALLGFLLVVLVFSSYYQVAPFEQGVVLRFGRYIGSVRQGPHLKLPFVDRVFKVPTERQLKEEFGFRTLEPAQRSTFQKGGFEAESLMLTGDLNIADVEFVVQYRIVDPYRYLFVLEKPQETVRAVAEAEMRGAVGDQGFDEVIKTRRGEIEDQVLRRMNDILGRYRCGVDVKLVQLQDAHPPEPVKDSFEEVNRALQEMERSINEALQERNKILFRVQGEAKQRIAQGEGAAIERTNRAQGDATRFELLLAEYRKAPAVTRQRLYLEAMQEVLPATGRLLVVDDSVKGMLPVLNLGGTPGKDGKEKDKEPKQ
jgi:membrane protease subunit HflK